MLDLLGCTINGKILALVGMLLSFGLTFIGLKAGARKLPHDAGRDFAHDGKLSAGKPRGAGFVFIIAFALTALLFLPFSFELLIDLLLTVAAMLAGFFDDRARKPWGELKKGLLDLVLAAAVALTAWRFNPGAVDIPLIGMTVTIHPVLYVLLATALIWLSINVTNCADGVDGLSGTLAIITLLSICQAGAVMAMDETVHQLILIMVFAILAYLWYNATPSRLLMGDAGSRALGLFIGIAILKTGSPLLYIPLALVLLIDGGAGLVKVTIIRLFKVNIMKNIRTPIHDHVRKNFGWSNTHTVFRFAIIQIVLSFLVLWLLKL